MFDLEELKNLFETGPLKDHIDAKLYVHRHFYPLKNGEHALIEDDKVEILSHKTMKEVWFPRFPDNIVKWYKKSTIPRDLICDIHKYQVGL